MKYFYLVLIILTTIFISCNRNNPTEPNNDDPNQPNTPTAKQLRGVLLKDHNNIAVYYYVQKDTTVQNERQADSSRILRYNSIDDFRLQFFYRYNWVNIDSKDGVYKIIKIWVK